MKYLFKKTGSIFIVVTLWASCFSSVYAGSPALHVIFKPSVHVIPMIVPGINKGLDIVYAGQYAYASDYFGSHIVFFNGKNWGPLHTIPNDDGVQYIATAYPKSGAYDDAWAVTFGGKVYHIHGNQWSMPADITQILKIKPNSQKIHLMTDQGFVFLIGENGSEEGSKDLSLSVYNPTLKKWSRAVILKDTHILGDWTLSATTTYDVGGVNATMFIVSKASTANPVAGILQINGLGQVQMQRSSSLPLHEGSLSIGFAGDHTGAYVIIAPNGQIPYLWYNHTNKVSGWQHVEIPNNVDFPGLEREGYASGVICQEASTQNFNQVGATCIDTLSDKPTWSKPAYTNTVDIVNAIPSQVGAWLSSVIDNQKPEIFDYNIAAKSLTATNFSAVIKPSAIDPKNIPYIHVASDNELFACMPEKKGGNAEMFIYHHDKQTNTAYWQPIAYNGGGVNECCIIESEDMSNVNGLWIINSEYSRGHEVRHDFRVRRLK